MVREIAIEAKTARTFDFIKRPFMSFSENRKGETNRQSGVKATHARCPRGDLASRGTPNYKPLRTMSCSRISPTHLLPPSTTGKTLICEDRSSINLKASKASVSGLVTIGFVVIKSSHLRCPLEVARTYSLNRSAQVPVGNYSSEPAIVFDHIH